MRDWLPVALAILLAVVGAWLLTVALVQLLLVPSLTVVAELMEAAP